MSEKQFYKASVKVEYEDNKGRVKYRKEEYLVNAVNPTDVEAKINKEMEGTGEFEIVSIVLTKILSVLD
ncbi:MAG: DUF4494 domain-containing protein [Candidatus Methanofastidiosa archaeon]|jgi:hypothetical protein|nr:DUF4494 domain-containing protein [Candidatus Methanofastidiosa archaeon]